MTKIYQAQNGKTLPLKLISPMLMDKVRSSVSIPEPPMYEAETAAGNIERHPHDEESLQTDEDREAWEAYKIAKAEATGEQIERIVSLLFTRGVDWDQVPLSDGEWREDQEAFDIEIPTDRRELYRHYIMTEIISSGEELNDLVATLMEQTGIPKEVMTSVRESFRGEVDGDPGARPETAEVGMELQPEV